MIIILNIIVIALVLLIAYWWMDQGFFSSLLHLAAVIAAGTLALAWWEPIAIDYLLAGGSFDSYAMGVTLCGLFALLLLLFRGLSDSIIRANIIIPNAADKALGATLGACSGILTIGFVFISIGFLQGPHEFMGFRGFERVRGQPGMMAETDTKLWAPVDRWTNGFYDWLSVSTMYPDIGGTPLKQYNPDLFKQASLLRDNFNGGDGQVSMPSDAATVSELLESDDGTIIARINFNNAARDFGRQLVLSSSQVRLVGTTQGNKKPIVLHPIVWAQETAESGILLPFMFDDPANYATSVPGRDDCELAFVFDAPAGTKPNFIQVRGTRFELPAPQTVPNAIASAFMSATKAEDTRKLGQPIDEVVTIGNRFKPSFRPSINRLPGTMQLDDKNKFESGFLRMPRSSDTQTSRKLQANSIAAADGTRIVQIEISADSPAWLGGNVEDRIASTDDIILLDSIGNKYSPIGYYFIFDNQIELKLDPRNGIRTAPELPQLSLSRADQKLVLVFQVTNGVRISSLRVGHTLIGTMNVDVPIGF
tara:strand:+ start:832 stop:2439 length:1608 start_codon:yes stop_codon:yes gene_type:complete